MKENHVTVQTRLLKALSSSIQWKILEQFTIIFRNIFTIYVIEISVIENINF